MTSQRRAILNELTRSTAHPTAGELYEALRAQIPRISLGTVYRNLELLAASGVIRKLELCGTPARFDARCHGHYHVRCSCCGRVDDVPAEPVRGIERAVERSCDYLIAEVRVECVGTCPACRGERPGAAGREQVPAGSPF